MGNDRYWKQTFYEMVDRELPHMWTIEICNEKPNQMGWKSFTQHDAFGKYKCPDCPNSWKSIHSVIEFYIQLTNRQGRVMMNPLGQQCKNCIDQYVKPKMPNRIITIIVQNLIKTIRKKCYGEYVPQLDPADDGQSGHGPHIKKLCQACHLGICKANVFISHQSSKVEHCNVHIGEEKPNSPLKSSQQQDSCFCRCFCFFAIILLYFIWIIMKH
ncbi:receptor-transporting protein 3 [Xenopus laevis]|uniref:Receptor-transporting protein 3 n=2 Tax=Xenopus laevis TaxID=8355 RepID=A0A1L8G9X3_XENLA|nr:receptor-transporting protein 3 [Xenopus laevis]OCT80650.1 hypothetical protein XELAEV_18027463mg [Xenopus laevis]